MITQQLIQNIGWTLIHSIWQGLAIYVVLKIAIRLTKPSDIRYGMAVVAMSLMVICSVITFFVLSNTPVSQGPGFTYVLNTATREGQEASLLQTVLQFIDQNIIWLFRFWILGFAVGLIRIAAGLWYIKRLRRSAHPVQEEWMDLVKKLSGSLNINRVVTMAEAGISSPMVVGFMKPMVLFPVGLLSGLSMEQVETILVHELSHVRRQDYIINLVQSIIETIFFFNPFVLLISSLIRDERENCCDDMVIAKGVSPISYVRTLAQLEASRSSSSLALGISGNQNQLLNRIKRIMENSAKNDWGKGRLVPVALLFLGLICASWLSIGTEAESKNITHNVLSADTNKPAKSREEGLQVIKRRSNSWDVIEPVPEIEFVPDQDFMVEFETPDMPDFAFDIPMGPMDFDVADMPPPMEFDGFDNFDSFDQSFGFSFGEYDSLPDGTYTFKFRDPYGKEEITKEFTMKFKQNFKEFYEKNQAQFDKMVKEMWDNEKVKTATEQAWKKREASEVVDLAELQRRAERAASADRIRSESVYRKFDAEEFRKQAELMAEQASSLRAIQADQIAKHRDLQSADMAVLRDQLRNQALIMEDMARRTTDYKEELVRMLREDGYIGKNDKEEQGLSIMEENGELTINGHKIKDKDKVKYQALRDRYFERNKRERTGRSE